MTYYIINEMGEFVTTETDKLIAELIASELGGYVVEG